MKFKKKTRCVSWKWLIVGLCLLGTVLLFQSSLSHTNAPIKAEQAEELEPGQIKLSKTAKPVAGMVNQWDLTLRIEGRNQFPPPATDIVLIIDTSWSMEENDRMIKAKAAAEKFVKLILRKKYANRIALISFDSTVVNYTFQESGWSSQFVDEAHSSLLIDKIREIQANPGPTGSDGKPQGTGTFTQDAIKTATELLKKATGDERTITLISDGVPTYSYPPTTPYNQLSGMEQFDYKENAGNGYTYYQSVKTIPKGSFDYSKAYGNGVRYRIGAFAPEYEKMPSGSKNRLIANHANSAIAEATIAKNETTNNGAALITDFYTIGVDLDLDSTDDEIVTGNQTLREIASSPEQCFAATADSLDDVLSNIAGEIVGAIKSGIVVDPMGLGFELAGEVTTSQGSIERKKENETQIIQWEVGALKTAVSANPDEDIMYAEMTYRVNATNDVLIANVIDKNGQALTNGPTLFSYIDFDDLNKKAAFDVPKVTPTIVSLQKKLLDETGNELADTTESFDFSYGADEYTVNDSLSLSPAEIKKIVHPWHADKKYQIEEQLKDTQQYNTAIEINGIETAGIQADFTFSSNNESYENQQIVVTNQILSKQARIKLYIRQSILQVNEEVVIPSKGFFKAAASTDGQVFHLTSGSTTKDTATQVDTALFTSYELVIDKEPSLQVTIQDLIPEYYQFYGAIATPTAENIGQRHLSTNTNELNRSSVCTIDYSQASEYWVTMFLIPSLGTASDGNPETSPRPYSWSYKTNQFGE